MGSLKKQTISGVKWLVSSSFLQKVILTASTVVLARILGPSEFGLFALAFVAIDALSLFKSMGFDSALIQRKDDIEKAANTAFFIIPAFGIMLYLILTISAPWIGNFLNNQDVAGIIKALGIIFVISCLGRVPAALLEKNMQFKQISIIEISTTVVYAVGALTFALLKFGVWSLVIAYILKTIYQNTLTFVYAKWRPRFEFDKKIALEMFHFGKFLFLSGGIWFLKMNLDNLLVGKLLGVTALGLYAIAFNVANFGADYFGDKIMRVTYPAYARLQNDLYDLQQASLKVFKHVSLVAIPFGVGIFLLGEELLRFIYGEKWIAAAGILKILAWAGIFNTMSTAIGGIFLACGKSKLGFLIISLQVAIFFVFIMPMAKLFGLNGVGAVVSISGFIIFVVALLAVNKLISLNLNQIYLSFKSSLVPSLVMASGIILLKNTTYCFRHILLPYYNFIILSGSAVIIYTLSLYILERSLFKNIKEGLFNG